MILALLAGCVGQRFERLVAAGDLEGASCLVSESRRLGQDAQTVLDEAILAATTPTVTFEVLTGAALGALLGREPRTWYPDGEPLVVGVRVTLHESRPSPTAPDLTLWKIWLAGLEWEPVDPNDGRDLLALVGKFYSAGGRGSPSAVEQALSLLTLGLHSPQPRELRADPIPPDDQAWLDRIEPLLRPPPLADGASHLLLFDAHDLRRGVWEHPTSLSLSGSGRFESGCPAGHVSFQLPLADEPELAEAGARYFAFDGTPRPAFDDTRRLAVAALTRQLHGVTFPLGERPTAPAEEGR